MIEVAFHHCKYTHEKGFILDGREQVREMVKRCLFRKQGLNPLCAHSGLGKVHKNGTSMLAIIRELQEKNPKKVSILYNYRTLIRCLDDISYFVHTNDYRRIALGTTVGDILYEINKGNTDSCIDDILSLCKGEITEISGILSLNFHSRPEINIGEKNRILFLMEKIQYLLESSIRKICLDSDIILTESVAK